MIWPYSVSAKASLSWTSWKRLPWSKNWSKHQEQHPERLLPPGTMPDTRQKLCLEYGVHLLVSLLLVLLHGRRASKDFILSAASLVPIVKWKLSRNRLPESYFPWNLFPSRTKRSRILSWLKSCFIVILTWMKSEWQYFFITVKNSWAWKSPGFGHRNTSAQGKHLHASKARGQVHIHGRPSCSSWRRAA